MDLIEKYLGEAKKISKAITNRINKLNKYIERANKADIYAVEPDSTWEEAYKFKPITIKGNFLYIEYDAPYSSTSKKNKERFNLNSEDALEDAKWQLNWVLRALKKGYKEEGATWKA